LVANHGLIVNMNAAKIADRNGKKESAENFEAK
jgi:hypothetical protein